MRGVAVMGILVANLPGFGLPTAAYFSPRAGGGTDTLDLAAWYANFVMVEGKFRGLFAVLFGASMLVVLERARAAGRNEVAVHLRRMAALFVIGVAHRYLLWWGDILAHYALVGTAALLFAGLGSRALLVIAAMLVAFVTIDAASVSAVLFAPGPVGDAWRTANESVFGVPPARDLAREIAAMRGGWWDATLWRWREAGTPFDGLFSTGAETLSAMLVGMAAWRSGFAHGRWPQSRYWRWSMLLLPCWAAYAWLGWSTWASGFAVAEVHFASLTASAPFRLLGTIGYAALIMALMRPGGALTRRLAAVGRLALSNYLATSLVMAIVFTGFARFATIGRAELYLLALPCWLAMLAWSPLWLARFRHGPVELVWRRLARIGG